MAYVPPNKLVMRIVPTTMGGWSDGRQPAVRRIAATIGPQVATICPQGTSWAVTPGGAGYCAPNPVAKIYGVGKMPAAPFGDAGDGLGSVWDVIGAAAGGAANYLKGTQTPPMAPVAPVDQGIDTSTLLVLGALGVGAFLVYKKMKKNRR